jgi:hypothetical protein
LHDSITLAARPTFTYLPRTTSMVVLRRTKFVGRECLQKQNRPENAVRFLRAALRALNLSLPDPLQLKEATADRFTPVGSYCAATAMKIK